LTFAPQFAILCRTHYPKPTPEEILMSDLTASSDTVNTRFAEAARRYPNRPALSSKPHGSKTWETLTYRDLSGRVRQVALGLRALGIERGDRVAILSENRPEWAILDLATLAAGAVSVPVYPTLPASQIAHILSDTGRSEWQRRGSCGAGRGAGHQAEDSVPTQGEAL